MNRDSGLSSAACTVQKGAKSLSDWLTEVWIKRWSTVKELEVPEIPWLSVDGGIQRLREIGMLKWIFCLKPNPAHWEAPGAMPFAPAVRHWLVRGRAADLKSTAIALLCVPDLTAGDAAAQLGNLNARGIIGPQSHRGQVAAWNHRRQGDRTYNSGQHRLCSYRSDSCRPLTLAN